MRDITRPFLTFPSGVLEHSLICSGICSRHNVTARLMCSMASAIALVVLMGNRIPCAKVDFAALDDILNNSEGVNSPSKW
jgi:hypothetical protein